MKLTSSAFNEGQMIPKRYSKEGGDLNPPLSIEEAPENTKSFALIVDDPDAPGRTFNHWILFNISPETREIAEGAVPPGALQGENDYGDEGYGGPQPPSGEHRYFFKLFALDTVLSSPQGIRRKDIDKAIKGHVLQETKLMGRFAAPVAHAR